MNYISQLSNAIHSAITLLQEIANEQPLSFDEAWSLVTIYKRYKDTDKFIDYIEECQQSEHVELLSDLLELHHETSKALTIYYAAKDKFRSFDPKPIYKLHLEPSYTDYQQAKEASIKAYDDFKPIQKNMDFPELHYSKEEIPAMWEVYNKKKEYSDSCSKHTKALFEVYDRERRRTAGLYGFKLSAMVMLIYSIDSMAKALIADLNDIIGKEEKV